MNKDEAILLKTIHSYSIELLDVLDKICKRNNLRYLLAYGTLLGAVREKGFIPWDDDVDVIMPREDYEKFILYCDESLPANIALQTYDTDRQYTDGNAHIRMKNTIYLDEETENYNYKYNGLWIDIWPVDRVNDINAVSNSIKIIRYLNVVLRIKSLKSLKNVPFKRKLLFVLLFLIPKSILLKIRNSFYKNTVNGTYYINFNCVYPVTKEVLPGDVFDNIIEAEFEGKSYPIPTCYDEILTKLYGNYMTPPPVESQKMSHSPRKIKI